MFQTSLLTRCSIDHNLFPLLTIRSCISEADDSRNGPRFCAQDKFTGCAYEVRSVGLDIEPQKSGETISKEDVEKLRLQHERIDALMRASASGTAPPCVMCPIDVYIQEQSSTGLTFVVSVDSFSGLSLGDIIRSGWSLVDEKAFFEILEAVELYGCVSTTLPPHGNLSADAIRQLLTVRDGAAEAEQRSRWVIGDWLLTYDAELDVCNDAQAFVSDIEWMLHSSFLELNVASIADGTFLSRNVIEKHINETVDIIREHLRDEELHGRRDSVDPTRRLSIVSSAASETQTGSNNNNHFEGDVGPRTPVLQLDMVMDEGGSTSHSSNKNSEEYMRDLALKDKLAYHQNALRHDQQLVNKYRRRNAPLPPLPQSQSVARQDYPEEDAEYELQYLTSPLIPRVSRLLFTASSFSTEGGGSGSVEPSSGEFPLDDPEMCAREQLLNDVVELALRSQQSQRQETRINVESQRMRREALRSLLMRNASLEAAVRRRAASNQQVRSANMSTQLICNEMMRRTPRDIGGGGKNGGNREGSSRRRPLSGTPRSGAMDRRRTSNNTPTRIAPQGSSMSSLGVTLQISSGMQTGAGTSCDDVPSSARTNAAAATATLPSTPVSSSAGAGRHPSAATTPSAAGNKKGVYIQPLPLASLMLTQQQEANAIPPQHSVRTSPKRRGSGVALNNQQPTTPQPTPRSTTRSPRPSGQGDNPVPPVPLLDIANHPFAVPQHSSRGRGLGEEISRGEPGGPIAPGRVKTKSPNRAARVTERASPYKTLTLSPRRISPVTPRPTIVDSVKRKGLSSTSSGQWSPRPSSDSPRGHAGAMGQAAIPPNAMAKRSALAAVPDDGANARIARKKSASRLTPEAASRPAVSVASTKRKKSK